MEIKFISLIMQWFMLLHSLLYFSIVWLNLFYFFLGSSSTIDGTKDTFQNIIQNDYDDEEESGVTMTEESEDYFWITR